MSLRRNKDPDYLKYYLRYSLCLVACWGVLLAGGAACLNVECSRTDVVCHTGAFLLYAEPDCNLTRSLAVGAFRQTAYIKASNAETNDFFGNGLAFDCSTQTLVVSTFSESSSATGVNGIQTDNSAVSSGAAYVFRYTDGSLAQEAYIKASNTGAGDAFGRAIALSGDTLAVGADLEASNATGVNGNQSDNSLAGAGAVYVFRRSANGWSQEAYIKASNTEAGDGFGKTLALAGDVLAVGATSEASASNGVNGNQSDNSAAGSGAVYVFRRTGTNWAQEAYLKASNTAANDNFGSTLAVYGGVLGVGAPGEDSGAIGVNGNQADNTANAAGAVYLFRNNGITWSQEFYIKASNSEAGDNFGDGLSISDGVMAVAASQEGSNATGVNGNQADNSASISGAVYVFRRSVSTWTQEAYVKASNTAFTDVFGSAVQISRHILAVGALNDDSSARGINGNDGDNTSADSGATYVFLYENGLWKQTTYLKSSNSDAGDNFGNRVALSGDVLVIASPNEDSLATGVGGDETSNAGTNAGAVYLFK